MVKPLKNLFTLLEIARGFYPRIKWYLKVVTTYKSSLCTVTYRGGDSASFFSSSCVTSTLRQMLGGAKVGTSKICHMLFDKVKNAIESLEVH